MPKSKRLKLNPNSISLAGEFAVLSQLALRGYDANMTLGNTKSVDILVSEPKSGKMYQLEVKAGMKNINKEPTKSKLFGKIVTGWIMRGKHETINKPNLFYCFVSIHIKTNAFRFFIVPSSVVSKYVRQEHQMWLRADRKGHKDTDMRTFRIGFKNQKYRVATPSVERYEDNWGFKL